MTKKSRNWSDKSNEDVSDVLTSGEVVFVIPVVLLLLDSILDVALVKKPVLANSLGKLRRLSEDLTPGLDTGEIILHAGARVQGVGK